MINIVDKKNCSGCKACYNICPKNCIEMITDEEGFWYPKVNEDKCIQCRLCEKVCPEINIYNNKESYDKPVCLAAWNNNKEIRKESSSGGIFTSIAEWILSNGGVVFGAGYDGNFDIVHKVTHTIEGLKELRGSKYVQSDINYTYKRAKQFLDKDKEVLFVGTPCQIAGLNNFLQKEYEKLYTCDLVCHGVPSPKVFKKYREYLEHKYNSNVEKIAFRDKNYGWKLFSVSLKFSNDTEYSKPLTKDAYMQGFLKNYYLRPSCYKCTYAKLPRVSDITLADFWGVGAKYPELDDDSGTSLLLINTEKGKKIIDGCENNIFKRQCDLNYAIQYNPCIVRYVSEPQLRNSFFQDFNTRDFDYLVKKYMSSSSYINRHCIYVRKVFRLIKKKLTDLYN